jgi:hypothetical protein
MGGKFIGVLVAVLVIWVGWMLYEYWTSTKDEKFSTNLPKKVKVLTVQDLGELPYKLEEELTAAQQEGAPGLKRFLGKYGKSPVLKDPRKAWIQLDYVLMVSMKDPGEARTVFREVKNRIGPDSPVYERVKKMQANYE